jgi:hypothetical protein
MLHGQKYTSDEEVEDAEDKWLCIKKKKCRWYHKDFGPK